MTELAPIGVGRALPHLSEEIWEKILSIRPASIKKDAPGDHYYWVDESEGHMDRIRLTCSLFARILRPQLFRHCSTSRKQLQYLFDCPDVGRYVRHLYCHEGRFALEVSQEDEPDRWIDDYSRPQSYSMSLKGHLTSMISTLDINKRWKDKYLQDVEAGYDDAVLLALVQLCPNITTMEFIAPGDGGQCTFISSLDHIFSTKSRFLQHLTSIEYHHYDTEMSSSFQDIQPLLLFCPSLHTLTLALIGDHTPDDSAAPMHLPKTNPSVRTVVMQESHYEPEDLARLLVMLPNLTSLEMNWASDFETDWFSTEQEMSAFQNLIAVICKHGNHLESLALWTYDFGLDLKPEVLQHAGDWTTMTNLKCLRTNTSLPLGPLINELQGTPSDSAVWDIDACQSNLPKNLEMLILHGTRRTRFTERPPHLQYEWFKHVEIRGDPGYINLAVALTITISEQGKRWGFGEIKYP